jgi:cation diffusion facilitator family transporter
MTISGRRQKTEESSRSANLRRLASWLSLGTAAVLVVVKFAAWLMTGSVALLTSAVDALVDAGASAVTFVGVRYAERPADLEHRFGHGKGEAVAAFVQGLLLAGAAVVLAAESVQRLIFPVDLTSLDVGLWVIVASLIAAVGLVVMQTWVVRRTGSTAIAADRAHYLTDIGVNVAVLAALAIAHSTSWMRADPLFALAISGYMLWNASEIADGALVQLLDRELPREERRRIERAVLACPGVRGIHDLRTRDAGDRVFAEFHLEVDPALPVEQGHAIADKAEAAVARLFPRRVEVTSHMEPAGIDDERLDEILRGGDLHSGNY